MSVAATAIPTVSDRAVGGSNSDTRRARTGACPTRASEVPRAEVTMAWKTGRAAEAACAS
jgi:hypothetical protein